MKKVEGIRLIGVRGLGCKSVALVFNNRESIIVASETARRLLGKTRWDKFYRQVLRG